MKFFLIDRITKWEPGREAHAVKNIALSEDFFEDHFPLKPIMPGVLIIEGMAQLSGILLEESVRQTTGQNIKALMSIIEKTKFRRSAYPGDSLIYQAKIESINELAGKSKVMAYVDEELIADCSLIFTFQEFSNPQFEAKRSELLAIWLQGIK